MPELVKMRLDAPPREFWSMLSGKQPSALWAVAAAIFIAGCAALASPQVPQAVLSALEVISGIVRQQTGRELADVPTTCETENHPESGELLILCTVKYR